MHAIKGLYPLRILSAESSLRLGLSIFFGYLSQVFPLFSGNQNAYLVRAVRDTSYGEVLKNDWLANTANVLPLFTWFTTLSLRIHPGLLYFYAILMNGAGFYALTSIAQSLLDIQSHRLRTRTLLLAFSLVFLAMLIDLLEIPFFSRGLAGQYLFSWYYQPSLFGVLLLCSVAALSHGATAWAICWAAGASAFHPTYILSTATLTSCALLLEQRKTPRRIFLFLGIAAGLTLPSLSLSLMATHASSSATQIGNAILFNYRIPHHAKPTLWFDYESALQMLWITAATWMARTHQTLRSLYAVALSVGTSLGILAALTHNATLSLLFPWRISTWLIPLSTTVIACRLCQWTSNKPRMTRALSAIVLLTVVALLPRVILRNAQRRKLVRPMVALVRRIPRSNRGQEAFLIPPWNEEGVQLNAPARMFVTHKAHPYHPNEVIEWWERLQLSKRFYASRGSSRCDILWKIQNREPSLQYVVIPAHENLKCRDASLHARGGKFLLYRLKIP